MGGLHPIVALLPLALLACGDYRVASGSDDSSGDGVTRSDVAEMCADYCLGLDVCIGDSHTTLAACESQCVDAWEKTLLGPAVCEPRWWDSHRCLADLDCDGWQDWWHSLEPPNPCADLEKTWSDVAGCCLGDGEC